MTGFVVSVGLLVAGLAALYGLVELLAPTSLRRRPNMKNDPKILGGEFNSGRGGHTTVWSVPSNDQEYAKIWSSDHHRN